jgi:membrane-bound ClpP family serine protease
VSRNAGFGGSLFLIAVGAVLAFAVEVEAEGFNLNTIGIILMVVGALGLVLTLVSNTATQKEERTEYVKKDIDTD